MTRSRQILPPEFNVEKLKQEILYDAKIVGIAESTAEMIAEKIAAATVKWVEKRAAVTVEDIHRRVAIEAERYNADLAYVYQNRGKII